MTGVFRNYTYGFLSAVIFGASLVVNKIGLNTSSLTSFQYTTVATSVAALLGLPFIIKSFSKLKGISRASWWQILVVGVGSGAVAYFFLFWGQRFTTAINAGFLVTLSLFLVLPFSSLLLREKFSKRKYWFILIMVVGVYLLTVGLGRVVPKLGDFLIIISSVIFSFNNALSKLPIRETGGELFSYLRNVIGAIALVVSAFFLGGFPSINPSIGFWVIVSGVFIWAALIFWYKAVDTIGPSQSAVTALSYPIVSTALSMALLQETLTLAQAFGGGLILFSIYQVIKK
ncbi:MAG: hypothetical protein UX85_C0001G0211 [Candidatus Beckwithbacteria bacterium GW2011_GWB1_47_15]|uniref:EamA domain-containing protein n=1 Tax=Candidatus Beckwithbacteria bacterium GW2011_GWB1_47_15 TaxID=1618371 RepID=A0A0G1RY08_9BACT|nr:MAG: hypothetical protein UY43_C0001G0914 [Candidatus Beckwithbacteria bacterium GW2011_GWC1_49_16]AQS30848.1 hypothetical protein [uncultured bacterium]KKU36033.1 MAG: hypothetical protein UX50_C0001G0210 [Candidatus Beckwithbacteria bacterium GW2011_GWA1_46_30]KKU61997.1 MAG: hypothetical protein UX85_C0001G0211 [Candidatus Beckwithbacteria bacterium GW2011_GWB1_47_15]KKU72449.1 MAG: hypothetical protein UX97_C0001G0319 [Candidatus Beckwithbacteria bacterium GW2011_GWA2_47_25]KKW04384.1 M